jgi:hypothetical protein
MLIMAVQGAIEKLQGGAAPVVVPYEGDHPDGTSSLTVAVRNGYKLETLRGRQRLRRSHIFDDLKSFAEWIVRHMTDQERAEIAVGAAGNVEALADARDPDSDRVSCRLRRHPVFAAWADCLGEQIGQRTLQQLVRASSGHVPARSDLLTALAMLKVAEGAGFEHRIDETGATRFSSEKASQTVTGAIPPTLILLTPIFEGVGHPGAEAEYEIEVLVSLDVRDGRVVFKLVAPGLELVLSHARRDVVAFLDSLLPGAYQVGLGTLETRPATALLPEPVELTAAADPDGI